MIIPDVNLLLYAYGADFPHHAKATAWWQKSLSGPDLVVLPAVVVFGFLRLGTSARVFAQPMTPAEAAAHVRSWLAQPGVQILEPAQTHVEQVMRALEQLGTAGNLVTDAQIAALAIEHDAVLHTNDTDFLRFPGLRCFNPLTEAKARKR